MAVAQTVYQYSVMAQTGELGNFYLAHPSFTISNKCDSFTSSKELRMKYYAISEPVLKSILAYLVQRPYSEVAEGIQILMDLPEVDFHPSQNQNETSNTHQ